MYFRESFEFQFFKSRREFESIMFRAIMSKITGRQEHLRSPSISSIPPSYAEATQDSHTQNAHKSIKNTSKSSQKPTKSAAKMAENQRNELDGPNPPSPRSQIPNGPAPIAKHPAAKPKPFTEMSKLEFQEWIRSRLNVWFQGTEEETNAIVERWQTDGSTLSQHTNITFEASFGKIIWTKEANGRITGKEDYGRSLGCQLWRDLQKEMPVGKKRR